MSLLLSAFKSEINGELFILLVNVSDDYLKCKTIISFNIKVLLDTTVSPAHTVHVFVVKIK